jgi:hypothetical protein
MFMQKRSTVFSMALLLALLFAAVLPLSALGVDGVTPPTDAPAADVPAVDAPVADAPVADVPAMDAQPAEDLTVPEVLDALPEGADLVVEGSTGDALPLVSQEAVDTLDSPSADPFFWDGTQYVGFSASGVCAPQVTGSCTTTATPLKDAITAFGASSTATGSIYVAAGTYAANVVIDGNVGSHRADRRRRCHHHIERKSDATEHEHGDECVHLPGFHSEW